MTHEEEMRKVMQVPLPPELEKLVSGTRSQFFSELGHLYEKSSQPYIIIIKSLLTQLADAKKDRPSEKIPVKNRAQRRAEQKKTKKQK